MRILSFRDVVKNVVGRSLTVPRVSPRKNTLACIRLKRKHMIPGDLLATSISCLGNSGSHLYFQQLRLGHLSFDR